MTPPRPDLGSRLTRAARAHRWLLAARLAEVGLHPGQDDLLRCLWDADGQSQADLAWALGVESPTVTKMVGRLEAAGVVRRRPHPHDRRSTQVWLTPAGRALRPAVQRARVAANREFTGPLTDRQRATLEQLLDRVVSDLDTQ